MEKNNKMNDFFWKEFLIDTENFNKPIIKKMVFQKDIQKLKDLVFISLKNMANEDLSPYGVWLNGENKNELKGEIAKGINEYDDIDSFSNSFFENYEFGVVAHHTNAYNDALAVEMYKMLFPLYDSLGVGIKGGDLNLFLGNYGWTPFGIHQDGKGENVIHFHLGPANKKMYLWSPDVYSKIENESLETKIEKAEYIFDIAPGDLFFMPHGYFHIGYTPEYSIGLTSWFCFPTYNDVREKIFNDLIKESNTYFVQNDETTSSYNIKSDFNKDTFKDIFLTNESSFTTEMQLNDLLSLYVLRNMLKLRSSLFYTWPILVLKNQKRNNHEILELPQPYKIYSHYIDETKTMFIYIKGHEFVYNHVDDIENIIDLIELLNNREKISLSNTNENSLLKIILNDLSNIINII